MRRLILFRHGKAEIAGLTGGDRERPLAERGRHESAMAARWLLDAGFAPDLVYVSDSLRTQATWDCARPLFPDARADTQTKLYLAGVETILEVLNAAPPASDTVMVVAHTPGLQDLALQLAVACDAPAEQTGRVADGFPTATACVFRIGGQRPCALEALFEPPGRGGGAPKWVFLGNSQGGPA